MASTNQSPRVLVFHPALAPYRHDLFNALATRRSVRVVFLSSELPYDRGGSEPMDMGDLAFERRVLPRSLTICGRIIPTGVSREVKDFDPDVVVTHEFSLTSGWMATRPRGRRPAWVIWTTLSPAQISHLAGIRLQAARLCARRCDALLAYSEAAADALARALDVPRDRIFICANHQDRLRIRARMLQALPEAVRECRALGIACHRLILVVGRLVADKNVATTIQAFGTAFPSDSQTSLVVIGEGPEMERLSRTARDAGVADRVHLLGRRRHGVVLGWLALASLQVLASRLEPYGAVVGEGLAVGVPALVACTAGAAHLVRPVTNGGLFEPTDILALASLMQSCEPQLQSAENLSRTHRLALPAPSVDDDIKGFLAACECALGTASS